MGKAGSSTASSDDDSSCAARIQLPAVSGYAELQCASDFSFLRGASSAEELFAQAAVCGHHALAITDRNSLPGKSINFASNAVPEQEGLKQASSLPTAVRIGLGPFGLDRQRTVQNAIIRMIGFI